METSCNETLTHTYYCETEIQVLADNKMRDVVNATALESTIGQIFRFRCRVISASLR